MIPRDQYFRAGAGAIISDGNGNVLALERANIAKAWQLPQGGVKENEEPLQAVLREVQEETGIAPTQLELLGAYPGPLAYELPPEARSRKTGRGQVQYWFMFRLKPGGEAGIDLAPGGEFRAWRWMPLRQLADRVVAFRAPIYRRLADYFLERQPAPE